MNRILKIVGIVLVLVIVAGYFIGVAVWTAEKHDTRICTSLDINIQDADYRQYVTSRELSALLHNKGLYPVGQLTAKLPVQAIENAVAAHPIVRNAEAYILPDGTLTIDLMQRIPLLKVEMENISYFIDSDRKRMPAFSSVNTPVMLVKGRVSERMAATELADLVVWMNEHKYWTERVKYIYVADPHHISLVQKDGLRILLGDVCDYDVKLAKLHSFYDSLSRLGWGQYKMIDLRFSGQVVAKR